MCEESVEDEYIREEEERQALPKTMEVALDILDVLTHKQRSRYIQSKVYRKSVRDIAAEEESDWTSVWECINAAEKRIEKELKKRGYNT